ncbi:acetyl-coenzyme A transporter 1-domain-containing protein [Phellopilus nigrolimitatus]|nr:acetyl-coenzyme A transporter 1-domain-containing protein [Phellopilus nigrolimitatus]
MSVEDNTTSSVPISDHKPRHRRKKQAKAAPEDVSQGSDSDSMRTPRNGAVSSSLQSIHVPPRTPRTAVRLDYGERVDEVEMSLLDKDERREAAVGVPYSSSKAGMSSKDKRGMVLLIVLYLIQGVPLGLALGSVPFLLREHLSYSQLAIFALAGYPYSLKLLWSPIVDSCFFQGVGRRKSWIIPMQLIIGTLMLWISNNVQVLLELPAENIHKLTFIFTTLVLISATQDIAVDGWALTLLSHENLSYASTCQTIGLNTGYFASFTVFLALNSESFAENWGIPVLSLSTYLRFWTVVSYSITLWLIFVKKEDKTTPEDDDMDLVKVYKIIWGICKLPHAQSLLIIHFVCKIGFQANEGVTSLKLVEKGLGREELALAVLIDFPFQLLGGYFAARWSAGDRPLRPWLAAFWVRLCFAGIWAIIVARFPEPPIGNGYFAFLVVMTILQGFSLTIQFVGMSAFHTRISDPIIGGTYMTLLNTFTNLGGTWPRFFVLKGVDFFTIATCKVEEGGSETILQATECVSDLGKAHCADIGGTCVTERDGYYIVSATCVLLGALILVLYAAPTARRLQALPVSKWRVNTSLQ